jgi:murein DD-endopeptidase MepM/ murein hydrolase activator NlpD
MGREVMSNDSSPMHDDETSAGSLAPQEENVDGDGASTPEAPESTVSVRAEGSSLWDRGRAIAIGAMGALVAVGLGLIIASPKKGSSAAQPLALTSADKAANTNANADADVQAKEAAQAALTVGDAGAMIPRPPPPWRVVTLKDDASVDFVEGAFGKKGLVAALTAAGLPRPEIRRLAQAFDGVHRLDRPHENDTFAFAKDKQKGTVVAFEYQTSPMDVWQARIDEGSPKDDPRLIVKKLDLFIEKKRVAHGLVISGDLAKAIAAAGMRQEIVDAVDDALEGHIEPGSIRAGVRMRVAATEDWVEGNFVRVKVDAVEFVPKAGTPIRVYFYERDGSVEGSSRRAPAAGFYDAKGRQPFHGQFRSPVPLARVTSRFNPKRMHPVLKVVMPHNGVDFGGSTGTPVYASGAGTVVQAGNGGPCGNMVEIDHGSGINTVYCHLKGFAHGLSPGQKVEARQLIGYIGQTGRVTGPHLHFGVKKHGVFIDPLGLKMDGVKVLPPADRDAFARRRSDLDGIIDGVALPSAADVPDENDDKDLHE